MFEHLKIPKTGLESNFQLFKELNKLLYMAIGLNNIKTISKQSS